MTNDTPGSASRVPVAVMPREAIWALPLMIAAEEFGVTSANIDAKMATLKDLPIDEQRLISPTGPTADMAKKLGLHPEWSSRLIKQVGNYGEVFEKHIGKGSPLAMDRAASLNRLTRDGGLMFSFPIR